jgi:magnesium-transporting ATPase (P-type)
MNRLLVLSCIVWICAIASMLVVTSVYEIKYGQYRVPYIILVFLIFALFIIYSICYGRTELFSYGRTDIFNDSLSIAKIFLLGILFFLPQMTVTDYLGRGFLSDSNIVFKYHLFGAVLLYAVHIAWLLITYFIPAIANKK